MPFSLRLPRGVVLLPHHTPSGACLNAAHWGSSDVTVNFATGHFTCATMMMHFSTSFRVTHSLVYHCYQQFVKTCVHVTDCTWKLAFKHHTRAHGQKLLKCICSCYTEDGLLANNSWLEPHCLYSSRLVTPDNHKQPVKRNSRMCSAEQLNMKGS